MLNLINLIKATVVCSVLNAIYTFIVASSSFQTQFFNEGKNYGRIESFIETSKMMEDFWPHVLKGWLDATGSALIICIILLLWLKKENT